MANVSGCGKLPGPISDDAKVARTCVVTYRVFLALETNKNHCFYRRKNQKYLVLTQKFRSDKTLYLILGVKGHEKVENIGIFVSVTF